MVMHKLLYLKQITNKDLLYKSLEHVYGTLLNVMWQPGYSFRGEWIHVYVRLSPFAVHLNIVNRLYLNTKLKVLKKENKLCVKKLLKGGTRGETTGGSYSTHWNFYFSLGKLHEGQKTRLNKPHPHLTLWEIRPGITHRNASHQSCRT